MEQEKNAPDSPFLKGATPNASRRPINAPTRVLGLFAGHPAMARGHMGDSILGLLGPVHIARLAG
jgi:hypothetical protein